MVVESISTFRGVFAVLVTPFAGKDGVDRTKLSSLATRVSNAGIHYLTALGNTAEVYQLETRERHAVLDAVARGNTGAGMVAGVAGALVDCVSLSKAAKSLGYSAIMAHEPLDPLGGKHGVETFLRLLADSSELPVIPYVRTSRVTRDGLLSISSHENIVAIKYARRDIVDLAHILASAPSESRIEWICGLAESSLAQFSQIGINSFTSGLANVRPDLVLRLWAAVEASNWDLFQRTYSHVGPFETVRTVDGSRYNVGALKAALRLTGVDCGTVRPPCEEPDERHLAMLETIVRGWPGELR